VLTRPVHLTSLFRSPWQRNSVHGEILNFLYKHNFFLEKAVLCERKSGTLRVEKYRFSHRKVPLFCSRFANILISKRLRKPAKRLRKIFTFLAIFFKTALQGYAKEKERKIGSEDSKNILLFGYFAKKLYLCKLKSQI